jgi:hypothetical protein
VVPVAATPSAADTATVDQQDPTSAASATESKKGGANDNAADNVGAAASGAAPSSTQAATSNQTPVAASVVVATAAATDAAAAPSPPDIAIGEQTRARTSLSRTGNQDSQPPQSAEQQPGPTAQSAAAQNSDVPADAAATKASASAKALQNAPAPGNSPTAPANNAAQQQDSTPIANNLAAVARGSALTTSSGTSAPPNPQTATSAVQSATASLPTFGIVAANAAIQNTAATSATTSGTVPISGLPVAIAARAVAGSNQFDIRLDPPELGRIDVQLNVDGNGQVTSHVTVDRPETLTLLQSQQPQLERALEQAGLKTADNGLQFSLRDQSFAGANTGGNNGGMQQSPSPAQQLVIPDSDMPAIDTTQIYSRWGLGGGVDITV